MVGWDPFGVCGVDRLVVECCLLSELVEDMVLRRESSCSSLWRSSLWR